MNDIAKRESDSLGLTEEQEELIARLEAGASEEELRAGYASAQKLGNMRRSETVQGELKTRREGRLRTSLAQKALDQLEDLITSEKTPAATRFSAIKWVLEQAGHRHDQDAAGDKPIAEMTEAELRAFIAKSQKVIEDGGKPPVIKVTPGNGAE